MKKFVCIFMTLVMCVGFAACDRDSTAREEHEYQDLLMQQAADTIGMPHITEFYEKKLAKEIFELRDDSKLVCYAYTRSEMSGKYTYLGRCMGYGLPYSTQYTNPETPYWGSTEAFKREFPLPQPDPNGLYSPEGLSATWLWMIDEETGEPNIMYAEPEIVVTQQKLPKRIVEDWSIPENY